MRDMKALIVAMVFMAVISLSGTVSKENVDAQTAAVILSGLVMIWYAVKVICYACKSSDKPPSR